MRDSTMTLCHGEHFAYLFAVTQSESLAVIYTSRRPHVVSEFIRRHNAECHLQRGCSKWEWDKVGALHGCWQYYDVDVETAIVDSYLHPVAVSKGSDRNIDFEKHWQLNNSVLINILWLFTQNVLKLRLWRVICYCYFIRFIGRAYFCFPFSISIFSRPY